MGGPITAILTVSFAIFCDLFSPISATFYIETLPSSGTERKLIQCLVEERPEATHELRLDPLTQEYLAAAVRWGEEAGAPSPPSPPEQLSGFSKALSPDEDNSPDPPRPPSVDRSLPGSPLQPPSNPSPPLTLKSKRTLSRKGSRDTIKTLPPRVRSPRKSKSLRFTRSKTMPPPDLSAQLFRLESLSARASRSFGCFEVYMPHERKRIYSTVNFYYVPNALLRDGHSIYWPGMATPSSFLVGVSLLGEEPDWPAFVDQHREDAQKVSTEMRQRCENYISPSLLNGVRFDGIVNFLKIAKFRHFLQPTRTVAEYFKNFAKLQDNIRTFYPAAKKQGKKKTSKDDTPSLDDLGSAVRLLLLKMIDPCIIANAGYTTDQSSSIDADTLCNVHCQFLGIGFSIFPDGKDSSAGCSSGIVSGSCSTSLNVCECKHAKKVCCSSVKEQQANMIQCSNALRLGITSLRPDGQF